MTKTVLRRTTAAAVLVAAGLANGLPASASDRQGTVEFLYGRYDVADARFKAVYPGSGPALGLALTASLFANLGVSLEVKHLSRSGALTYTKETTSFRLLPISLGLRYVYPGTILQPFAGGGLDYNVYYENNPIGTTVNAARGGHLEAGLYLRFGPKVPVLLVGKAKRVWMKADKAARAVDLGGWEYGGGLAVAF
jgi:hypothetical protein